MMGLGYARAIIFWNFEDTDALFPPQAISSMLNSITDANLKIIPYAKFKASQLKKSSKYSIKSSSGTVSIQVLDNLASFNRRVFSSDDGLRHAMSSSYVEFTHVGLRGLRFHVPFNHDGSLALTPIQKFMLSHSTVAIASGFDLHKRLCETHEIEIIPHGQLHTSIA